ncbi:MAG TPA: zinc ribbon domain-containing protein [Anaerolineaceae bacterium]|nr:zinc ribbon domain-containing protein [Anaerolineaceae bacterium]
MATFSRMPRYDIRNDGIGPYAVFYCDTCGREFRSQPDVAQTITQDLGRNVAGGLLRRLPLGNTIANSVVGEDPRYSYKMTPAQIEKAWEQVQIHFRECPTCLRIVCLSDFDAQSGYCNEDSPRKEQIAEAEGQQAGAALRGLASAFGLGDVAKKVEQAVKQASTGLATCPNDGTTAPAGTKFCPECGTPMQQPAPAAVCPSCGAETKGAKFCPECGTRLETRPTHCPSCGAEAKGAKFCPECGTKIG